MEEIFVIWTFIDKLSVLEFVCCFTKYKPSVLMAPDTIIRPMMMPLNDELISGILDIVDK